MSQWQLHSCLPVNICEIFILISFMNFVNINLENCAVHEHYTECVPFPECHRSCYFMFPPGCDPPYECGNLCLWFLQLTEFYNNFILKMAPDVFVILTMWETISVIASITHIVKILWFNSIIKFTWMFVKCDANCHKNTNILSIN